MQVAPRIHRIGTSDLVNAYLVEEAGEVTLVDAGAPTMWRDLPAELAAMGRSLDDVRAILLTHGHIDHVGFAEEARRARGWPVWISEADAALARGEVSNPARVAGPFRPWPVVSFFAYAVRNGLLRQPKVAVVSTFGDGATLDVPGAPRVTFVPGHTPGSAVLQASGHGAI